jgi:hypothetical protein
MWYNPREAAIYAEDAAFLRRNLLFSAEGNAVCYNGAAKSLRDGKRRNKVVFYNRLHTFGSV